MPSTDTRSRDVETRLAEVWEDVLGTPVGPHDNFFDLGGDSLLIFEVAALARGAGVEFDPPDLLEHQTVAELAAVARVALDAGTPGRTAHTARPDGELTPTPAQRIFCAAQPDPGRVTQAVVWRADGLDPDRLAKAVHEVLSAHDSFALRLGEEGRLRVAADAPPPVERSELSPADLACLVERMRDRVDPRVGPTVRCALVATGTDALRLVVAAHHLAVDGASWRILRREIVTAYRGDGAARAAAPSYRDWHAHSGTGTDADDPRLAALPCGPRVSDTATTTLRPSVEATTALLAGLRTGKDVEALVVGLGAAAVAAATPVATVTVAVEQHARDHAPRDLTPSATTGWCTRLRTAHLAPADPRPDAWVDAARAKAPRGSAPAAPELLVNYLGRFTADPADLLTDVDDVDLDDRHADNRLACLVEIGAAVEDGRITFVVTARREDAAGPGPSVVAVARVLAELLERTAAARTGAVA